MHTRELESAKINVDFSIWGILLFNTKPEESNQTNVHGLGLFFFFAMDRFWFQKLKNRFFGSLLGVNHKTERSEPSYTRINGFALSAYDFKAIATHIPCSGLQWNRPDMTTNMPNSIDSTPRIIFGQACPQNCADQIILSIQYSSQCMQL